MSILVAQLVWCYDFSIAKEKSVMHQVYDVSLNCDVEKYPRLRLVNSKLGEVN